MKAVITVEMENAAFDEGAGRELARILRKTAKRIEGEDLREGFRVALLDVNGNKVGAIEVSE
jgi:hypothetical protein